MAKSDEGHYELVLGNRQLVSGFFVLVILFAIFLTLGYILGRNSVVVNEPGSVAGLQEERGRAEGTASAPAGSVAGKPSAAENATEPETRPAGGSAEGAQPSVSSPGVATVPASTSPAVTTAAANRPAESPAPSSPAKPAPPPAKPDPAPAKPATTPAAAPAERAKEILGGKVQLITPRKGDVFLQVAAIGRAEAELMAEQLRKRSYRAFLSEVPGKDLFRVLIGPFETAARMNENKKRLSDEGLPSIVQRY